MLTRTEMMDLVYAVHYFETLIRLDSGRHIREKVCAHVCAMTRNVNERDTHLLSLQEAEAMKRGLTVVKRQVTEIMPVWKASSELESIQDLIARLNQTIRSERAAERASIASTDDSEQESILQSCPNQRHTERSICTECERCPCLVGSLTGGQLCGGCL